MYLLANVVEYSQQLQKGKLTDKTSSESDKAKSRPERRLSQCSQAKMSDGGSLHKPVRVSRLI